MSPLAMSPPVPGRRTTSLDVNVNLGPSHPRSGS